MDTVTLTISRDDAECLMVILDSQADRLRSDDPEAWDKMCNVTEQLGGLISRDAILAELQDTITTLLGRPSNSLETAVKACKLIARLRAA